MTDDIDISILNMLSHGYSRPEISDVLGWKQYKLDYRIQEMMSEFDCRNAAHLVAYAFRKELIK